jgi:hypothetical protein
VVSIFRVEGSDCYLLSRLFLAWLFFDTEDVLPKRGLIFNGLHGVTCQKAELFRSEPDGSASSDHLQYISLRKL